MKRAKVTVGVAQLLALHTSHVNQIRRIDARIKALRSVARERPPKAKPRPMSVPELRDRGRDASANLNAVYVNSYRLPRAPSRGIRRSRPVLTSFTRVLSAV